ncbi:MAG: hypothetical protein GKR89_32400 [Candidatus Latescibacteria bacterium]|nr:hypothetical protein [Candidatus Latescibacterota bacterium]
METTTALPDDDIGLIGRMIRVFYAPGETFAAVRQRQTWADWVIPLLVVMVVAMAAAYVIMPVVKEFTTQQMSEQFANNPDIKPEDLERIEKMQGTFQTIGILVATPAAVVFFTLLKSALLLILAKFFLGGEIRFNQTLAISAYAGLIEIVRSIVTTPLILSNKTLQIQTGLGLLLPEETLKTFLGRYLAAIELFTFWQVGIAAVGLTFIAGLPFRKAFVGVLVMWLLWLVVQAGLGGLGAMFNPGG